MKGEKMLIGVAIVFCVVLTIAGGNTFLYLMSTMPNYELSVTMSDYIFLNLSMVTGITVAYLLMKWRKNWKDKIPAVDERTIVVMKNYFLYVLYFIFLLSGIILLVLFFQGVQTIEIGAIVAYLAILIVITSVGALVAIKA